MIPLPYHQSASGSAEVKTRMTAVYESRLYDSSPDVELLIHVWPRKHEFVKNPLRTKAYPRNRHLLEPFWSFVISSRNISFLQISTQCHRLFGLRRPFPPREKNGTRKEVQIGHTLGQASTCTYLFSLFTASVASSC